MPTAWTTIAGADVDAESPVTAALATALRDNPIAITEGASGAPSIVEAAIGAAAISQGKIKTATGDVSTTLTSPGTTFTLPGGQYGFWPSIWNSSAGQTSTIFVAGATVTGTTQTAVINLSCGASGTAYARQRYVQASPPYDLGDGHVPLFVFAGVNGAGVVVSVYVAPDPPWANNGPTDLGFVTKDAAGVLRRFRRKRPTQPVSSMTPGERAQWLAQLRNGPLEELPVDLPLSAKNADMQIIPHPFHALQAGQSIVLIDPVGRMAEDMLLLHESGESVSGLLHGGHLRIDNVPLTRATPPGVPAHTIRWR